MNRAYYLKKARRRNAVLEGVHRRQVLNYLMNHPCVDCGESDAICLEFDHVRGKKKGNIARMLGNYGWPTIEKEIAKCEVRCANCHRRKTARQRGYYRTQE
jgi:hypothetical protein